MKEIIIAMISALGATIAQFFGGWDDSLTILCVIMALDYMTGVIVGGVFHASEKTESGALNSREATKGVVRKIMMLFLVGMVHLIDKITGTSYLRDMACMFFLASEALSVLENVGLMGVEYPSIITDALEILKKDNSGSVKNKSENDDG